MSRKLSWFLFILASLIWSTVFFQLSAFAAGDQPQQFVWTAQTQPIPGSAQVIEMKPTMLAPKGAPPLALRTLLTRVLGKNLGGFVNTAGVVYHIVDLFGNHQNVCYAIGELTKNGQPITSQTIDEWIAAQNGIDTSQQAPSNTYAAGDGLIPSVTEYPFYVSFGGSSFIRITGLQRDFGISATGTPSGWHFANTYCIRFIGPKYQGQYGADTCRVIDYYYVSITESQYLTENPPSGGFDPANYPEIFGPEYFPSQAIDALVAQDLDTFDIVLNKVNTDLDDHVYIDVAAKYPTAETEWTEVYASNGQTYRIPIGALGGSVVPQYQPPSNSVDVQTASGQTTLSNADSQPFIAAGVPQGATIVQANPQTGAVTYINPTDGQAYTAQVSPSSVSNLTNNHAVYNTYNDSTEVTNIHQEISLPEVHVSGSLELHNGTIDPVSEDRVEAARLRFLEAWQDLKSMFMDMLSLNLPGSGRLPVWTWSMLGQTVVIDFNDFATELNWFGLAFLFLATVSSVFLVISK